MTRARWHRVAVVLALAIGTATVIGPRVWQFVFASHLTEAQAFRLLWPWYLAGAVVLVLTGWIVEREW